MAFEQKDMSGALFKNDERTEENNQPNAKSRCRVNGVDYFDEGNGSQSVKDLH